MGSARSAGPREYRLYEKGRAWIELNLEHLGHNVRCFQKLLPEGCALMPAVKANAYGHGAAPVAKELQRLGITDYCVASAEEGIQLRLAGISGQILVLGYTHPRDFDVLSKYRLTQTVLDAAYAEELRAYGKNLSVHVGIDTGMHRLGEAWDHLSGIRKLWEINNLRITGVYSHLCTSDGEGEEDQAYMRLQETRFQQVVRFLRAEGKRGFSTHLQGSYGILNGARLLNTYDYARAGIALYGVFSGSSARLERMYGLKPVLSLKARITCIRTLEEGEGAGYSLSWHADARRRIAAAAIGYADGFPRTLSNKGHALVRGRKVPVVGRVCMDQLLLDVTDVPEAVPGEEAVFIGESEGLVLRAEEMAEEAGTISNEILSGLGERLVRVCRGTGPHTD